MGTSEYQGMGTARRMIRRELFGAVLLCLVIGAVSYFSVSPAQPQKTTAVPDFEAQLAAGNIKSLRYEKSDDGTYSFHAKLKKPLPDGASQINFDYPEFPQKWLRNLEDQKVVPVTHPDNNFIDSLIINVAPILLIAVLFWFYMFRHMRRRKIKALAFRTDRGSMVNRVGSAGASGKVTNVADPETLTRYRAAAEQGDVDAQYNLGVAYTNGAGVPEDYVLAYMWFNVAGQSDDEARKNRDYVAERMTPAQVAEAQKLSRERAPSH